MHVFIIYCVCIQVCMYICVDACSYVCMYVCVMYWCIYFRRYGSDVCMYAYAYTFVIYILCAESVTEAKKYWRTTCSRGQHTYFVLRMCRVEISAHILITWYLFCHLYYSLEECSGIVPETKPPPLLCTCFTICYSLQLRHQKLAQIVPSPFRQANTTHTTPRALHRLHYLKLTVSRFLSPSLFLIWLSVPPDRNMQSEKSGDSFPTTSGHSFPDPRTVTGSLKDT